MADDQKNRRTRPSLVLLLAGLASLALAVPTVLGIDPTALLTLPAAGWFVLGSAGLVGLALVFGPRRRGSTER